MFIPGFLIAWVTFPGTIIHEFAHKKACEWRGIRVREVNYFSLNGSGYVKHHTPHDYRDSILISTAPLGINTAIAFCCWVGVGVGFASAFPSVIPESVADPLTVVLLWLGVSVGMGAIPSTGDTDHVWREVKRYWRRSMLAALLIPAVAILYLANLLSFLWADLIYSIAVGVSALWVLSQLGTTTGVI